MSRSKFWSVSQSTGRVALATAAVATLAIIAACSNGDVASNVAAPSLRAVLGTITPLRLANAGVATLCVSSSSPDGTYTFVNSGFYAGANAVAPVGVTTENVSPDGVTYTLEKTVAIPNPCVNVLTRSGIPVDFNALDAFSYVTIENTVTPPSVVYSSTTCEIDAGNYATSPCANPSLPHVNFFHGSKTTFNFCPATGCYSGPYFVVGDKASGLALAGLIKNNTNTLNFWGSQWWKNNPMSLTSTSGWPSFKGFATTGGDCGDTWTSRVGNSPPPPATIPDIIQVIVTDKVWKDGPDLRGTIRAIITVEHDHGYGPNPGHDGNGPRGTTVCGAEFLAR